MTVTIRPGPLAVGLCSVLAITSSAQAAEFTMKIAHVSATTQPLSTCAEVMKSYVERYSNGRIEVQHYPAGQLGTFRENVEAVQLGTLEMTLTSGGGIANFFGPIQAFDIPYLFADDQVMDKVMADRELTERLRADVLEATGTVRLMGMTGGVGWRDFFANVPVKTAADLEGVKMRTVESPVAMEFASALGMNPTPVPWPELYTSLATGVVNGTKNALSDVVDTSLNDYVKHAVADHHTHNLIFWWMSDPWLKSLPEDLQVVVADGFHELSKTCNGLPGALYLEKYEKFVESGGEVHIPTEEEKASFLPGQQPVIDWFVDKYGSEYYDLVRAAVDRAEAEIAAERSSFTGE
ncbi:TRAP transporter substrate-binding protein DctP [Paracoccus seriniphilus]|uniref:TRAP-type C4-dicarboxylate transport system, substrate-binding protein n=1 Tax=Paracoccus seriniphilus TaxID=184748 RepID=A0A239Q1C4_9RHOB|nr:TRAP transporter substrate-binding protein DctP [Paracoccus seriniphilus]WCR16150.1 TRAP transporter substrate-binding protein DctP [Paracoccus seriniphilus]SNT76230.1 TRAP-type C4-dicarboxylate transport system, substrate-binding protein [Paracoccus seriniphilus]